MRFNPVNRLGTQTLAVFVWIIGGIGLVSAQDPVSGVAGAANATADADGFAEQPKQLTSTFVDPRSGRQYGRYIIYENVPVVGYQQQEVMEKQWVPEWVVEQRQVTQTNYVPIVTYQLQLQTEQTINPFVQPRRYWQYVPVVQYQANHTPVNQPIRYQKYVEKEIKKIIPVLVSQTQRVPRFADLPLEPQSTTLAANGVGVQPPGQYPTRSLDPSQVASAAPTNNVVPWGTMAAPQPYYPNGAAAPNASLANVPAYNANPANWGQAGYAPAPVAGNPAGQWVNQPNVANGGVAPLPATPYAAANSVAGYPPVNGTMPYGYQYPQPTSNWQMPAFMAQFGSLFQGGVFRNNPPSAGNPTSPTYVASNPYPFSNGQLTGDSSSVPSYGSWSSSGATFVPRSSSQPNYYGGAPTSSQWNVVPVNNYRDPSQQGIPASVLR